MFVRWMGNEFLKGYCLMNFLFACVISSPVQSLNCMPVKLRMNEVIHGLSYGLAKYAFIDDAKRQCSLF